MEANGQRTFVSRLFLILLAALALLAGCSQSATSPGADASSTSVDERRGQEITEKMLAFYRQTRSYADHASYTQHYVRLGEGIERDQPFFDMALAFERPNRLRLSFSEAVEESAARKGFDIASNGVVMWATAGLFPGQVQESAAPKKITAQNVLPDVLLRDIFVSRSLGDVFPQLAMLLNEDDKTPVFPEDEKPTLLDTQQLRGRNCYRVVTTSPRGKRTFWIDAENYTLHRMELPVEADLPAMDPQHQYSQLAIWIDFEEPAFNKPIDSQAFVKTIGENDRRVRRFVAPPPDAPPESLGKPLADFEFETADGKPLTAKELARKTILLDFWQVDCAPCKAQTPAIERIREELKGDENFAVYAVNIEGARHAADILAKTMNSWGGAMPLLRDPKQTAVEKLKVEGTPTLMLLDAQGRLQYLHGGEPIDAKALATLIRRVIAGADLAAEARTEHAQLVKDYQRELAAVTINNDAALEIEVPQPQPAERKLPEKIATTQLWEAKADDIAHPGYILRLVGSADPGKPSPDKFLVLDGGEAVVEFNANGEKLAAHEIYGSANATNGFLRTRGEGMEYILVSGVGWQKVFVFDAQWKQVLEFPKDRHQGIADAQFSEDPRPDKAQIIVGYWGGVGIQGVGLDGRRKWSQRSLDQVVQITNMLVPKKQNEEISTELWCTSSRGSISVFDGDGKPLRELPVGLRSIMYFSLTSEQLDQRPEVLRILGCGLALENLGQYEAVGFDRKGEIAWRFHLPAGEYVHHFNRIQPVMLPGNKHAWMIAAADGTIFWIDHEGQLIDKFAYGKPLTGIAMTNTPDAAILLVSTSDNLTAWKLTENK